MSGEPERLTRYQAVVRAETIEDSPLCHRPGVNLAMTLCGERYARWPCWVAAAIEEGRTPCRRCYPDGVTVEDD